MRIIPKQTNARICSLFIIVICTFILIQWISSICSCSYLRINLGQSSGGTTHIQITIHLFFQHIIWNLPWKIYQFRNFMSYAHASNHSCSIVYQRTKFQQIVHKSKGYLLSLLLFQRPFLQLLVDERPGSFPAKHSPLHPTQVKMDNKNKLTLFIAYAISSVIQLPIIKISQIFRSLSFKNKI